MNKKKVVGIVFITICVLYVLFFLGVKVKNAIFTATAERTIGYVTDVQSRTTRTKSSRNNYTTTRYTMSVQDTVDDVDYTTVFNSGSNVVSEGKTVVVYYKKSNPKRSLTSVQDQMEPNFFMLIVFILGVLFLINGLEEEKKAMLQQGK